MIRVCVALTHCALYLFPSQGSDDESYVSDVSDNISEDNASVTDNVSRQSRYNSARSQPYTQHLCYRRGKYKQ